MTDIPLNDAMLCYDSALNGGSPRAMIVLHPDERGLSDRFTYSVGACFTNWRDKPPMGQKLQLLIDAWHACAFYGVPAEELHKAMLAIPEYREMLADDCLPEEFMHERV
jgi:hypothetical protein